MLSALDALATLRGCSRPEAIRIAVDAGLAALRKDAPPEPAAGRGKRPQSQVAPAEAAELPPAKSAKGKKKSAKPAAAEPEAGPSGARFDLPLFAVRALEAGKSTKTGRFGDDRVFISHVWRQFEHDPASIGMTLEAFKQRLLEANRQRYLSLVCADMAPKLNQKDVRESEIRYGTARFHFLCI
jgi:hypothetical protein